VQRNMCKSKIHRARVTDVNLNYEGSLTLDRVLMKAANLLPYEKVQVLNLMNGSRAETYIIEGKPNSGIVCVNGALARLAQTNDLIIILAFALVEENELSGFKPCFVRVDNENKIIE
jgi:aspartate 1-decarboxylase